MAIVIPYVKQTWTDGSSQASAARLGVLEEGILDVSLAPCVRAFHNTTQSITTATDTALNLNSERFDQAGGVASTMHDTVTNNTRLTAVYAGVYLIGGCCGFNGNATGIRIAKIRLNGTTEIARTELVGSTSYNDLMTPTCIYSLAVSDYVELVVNQTSGGNLSTQQTANSSTEFWMVRVG